MTGLLGFLAGAVSMVMKVWGWFSNRSVQQQGADAQTARDNAASATAQTRIAQAEADAPKSDAEVDQRLKDHSL